VTLSVDEVPVPALASGEVLLAVMASSLNHNTVWSATFEPCPTFRYLEMNARLGGGWQRHDLPYHVLGSDACGIVLRVGQGVARWHPGDRVVVHSAYVDLESPESHADSMLDPSQCAWGYETNFGGLADLAVVRATQLLPKAAHLSWEEAAVNGVANSTAYRQLVSSAGANMRQGDVVLIWGAAGGIGSYAVQYALKGGAFPVAVVSSLAKAELVRAMGCEAVIDRAESGFSFWRNGHQDPAELHRFRDHVRRLTGGYDPDIVFEHTGRDTLAASVFVAARGGTIVTCASTSGFEHTYDNRYLWMKLKRISGSHIANLSEANRANRLVANGAIYPTLSHTAVLSDAPEAAKVLRRNGHTGKVGVFCLAQKPNEGVTDYEFRARHEDEIMRFRRNCESKTQLLGPEGQE